MLSHRNGGDVRRVRTYKLTGDALTCLHQSNGFQHTLPTRLILRSGHPSSARREGKLAKMISWKWAVFLRLPKPLAPGSPFHTGAGASSLRATALGWRTCRSGSVSKGLYSQFSREQPGHPKDATGTVLEASRLLAIEVQDLEAWHPPKPCLKGCYSLRSFWRVPTSLLFKVSPAERSTGLPFYIGHLRWECFSVLPDRKL